MATNGEAFQTAREHVLSLSSHLDQFVWLWTWINSHVADCENAVVANGQPPLAIEPAALRPVQDVGAQPHVIASDLLAHLQWLDEQLGRFHQLEMLAQKSPGADGESYRVLKSGRAAMAPPTRRATLANLGGSVRSYARHHICVPLAATVSDALLAAPLRDELAQSVRQGALRALPLESVLTATAPPLARVTIADPNVNRARIESAIRACADDQIDILVLPELSVATGMLDGPDGVRSSIDSRFPVLVIAGIEHHQDDDGVWRNIALMIDRYGNVIHRHLKVTSVDEVHQVGDELAVLPSPLGLVSTPICRDLFHQDSPASPSRNEATLILCPSLSPKTDEHQFAANQCRQRTGAVTIVVNRWGLGDEAMHPALGTSFVLRPGRKPDETIESITGEPIDITW